MKIKENSELRKLSVVVFTDIVNFTEKMAKDENYALEMIDFQRNLLKPIVETYSGSWIKEIGDGLLLTFDSVHSSVYCCIDIQNKIRETEDLELRISIHLGEIIVLKDDVYGDDVNITSRIEKYAPAGGIAVSESVKTCIDRIPEIKTILIGSPTLKGVNREIKIHAITSHNLTHPHIFPSKDINLEKFLPSLPKEEVSVLVLPFKNSSVEEKEDYLSDGLTDVLIGKLGGLSKLRVISRTTSMHFKKTNKTLSEIANSLGLEYIIEGSIFTESENVLIQVNLINVKDDKQIWSNFYEKKLDSVISILNNVTDSIISGISKHLNSNLEKTRISIKHGDSVVNPEAYKLFLKGRQLRQRKDSVSFDLAKKYLSKSIEIDPYFGKAYAELGFNTILNAALGNSSLDSELRNSIQKNVDYALKFDPHATEAYITLALTWEFIDHDQEQAAKYAEQAVFSDPQNVEILQEEAFILGRLGRYELALNKMYKTLNLDPYSILSKNGIAFINLYKDDYDKAIIEMENLLLIEPKFVLAHYIISLSLSGMNKFTEALNHINKIDNNNQNINILTQKGYIFAKLGDNQSLNDIKTIITDIFHQNSLYEFSMGLIYFAENDLKNAMEYFQKSHDKYGFINRDFSIGRDFRMDILRNQLLVAGLKYL